VPRGLRLSDSEKSETLSESVEAELQSVDDLSAPAFIEMLNEAMCPFGCAPTSEPKLTSPSDVIQSIKGQKIVKSPGPNGIPNRLFRHLPKCDSHYHECLKQPSAGSTSYQSENMLAWYLCTSRETIPRCFILIDPQVYLTLLSSSSRRSY
jgi:hypothetical protein